ncbi:hypothetical protein MRX96_054176 [Rhipicephalus microplus]
MAKVDVKIKLATFDTKCRDKYLQREVPLSAVIRIDDRHSHSTDSADALRLLRGTRSTRQTFLRYFSEGMTPSEAKRLHESKLSMEDDGPCKAGQCGFKSASKNGLPLAQRLEGGLFWWYLHRPSAETGGKGFVCSPRHSHKCDSWWQQCLLGSGRGYPPSCDELITSSWQGRSSLLIRLPHAAPPNPQ